MIKLVENFDKTKSYYLDLLNKNNSRKYEYFKLKENEEELNGIINFYVEKYYNLVYYRESNFSELVKKHYPKNSSSSYYNFSDSEKNELVRSRKNFQKDFIERNNRTYPPDTTCEISSFTILEYNSLNPFIAAPSLFSELFNDYEENYLDDKITIFPYLTNKELNFLIENNLCDTRRNDG